jgi:molybdopterin-guanine dinucleotide biosynthesis protein A
MKEENLYGLVIAGGNSNRMGTDKSWLRYHGKPQLYHVYDLLSACTNDVYISCNKYQKNRIFPYYKTIVDKKIFENQGPIAALLTAFNQNPDHDLLVLATDYPFLTAATLSKFADFAKGQRLCAFFNAGSNVYEPILAYYPKEIYPSLKLFFDSGKNSLQQFLAEQNAAKFFPEDINELINVNTQDEYYSVYAEIQEGKTAPLQKQVFSTHNTL